ncbi:MAG: pyridoxamine 5'-phosphate oxidase [Alphaproteobacteria bacterium]
MQHDFVVEEWLKKSPFVLFQHWFADAKEKEAHYPDSVTLATFSPQTGRVMARIMLLKSFDERGFCFFTNLQSNKGNDLGAHPQAALCFYWKSCQRQVRVEGVVEKTSDEEADAYFQTRPYISQIGAWASQQSKALESRALFEAKVEALQRQYPEGSVPRPLHWSGYRLVPNRIEFWEERPFRLHERMEFSRASAVDHSWHAQRLYP